MTEPPHPPDAEVADHDGLLRLQGKFDSALAKYLLTQGSKFRELEDAMRGESTAMLKLLQDQACAQVSNAINSNPPKSGLNTMIDALFIRPEVQYGLVVWPTDDEICSRAKTLVAELRVDISAGDGNEAQTTLNKLLPLYMEALNIQEILELYGDKMPTASPGGKNGDKQRKLLGNLAQGCMRPYFEAIQMVYADLVSESEGESYAADKSLHLRGSVKRLQSALFVFLNTGNFTSHNRGKLSYCQQVELCVAVGAMAETLPQIAQACQEVKTAQTAKAEVTCVGSLSSPKKQVAVIATDSSRSSRCDLEEKLLLPTPMSSLSEPKDTVESITETEIPSETTKIMETKVGSETRASEGLGKAIAETPSLDTTNEPPNVFLPAGTVSIQERPGQFNFVAYYKNYLVDRSREEQAKYEATLLHMELVPKARLCVKKSACSNGDGLVFCNESRSILEALPYNPVILTLKCPAPESCWHDFVHENKCCLFNHGEYKGPSTFRWMKRNICGALASCTDFNCLKAHSLAEVCWFNPYFRTSVPLIAPKERNVLGSKTAVDSTRTAIHDVEA